MEIEKYDSLYQAKVTEMENYLNNKEVMTSEERAEYEKLAKEANDILETKKAKEEQKRLSATVMSGSIRNEDDGEKKAMIKDFVAAAKNAIRTNVISSEWEGTQGGLILPKTLKTVTSSTDAGIIRAGVAPELSIVSGDNFTLALALGVPFYEMVGKTLNLNGAPQAASSKPTEGNDPSTAGFDSEYSTITATEYSNTESISKLAILSAPDSLFLGWIQDMQMANERKQLADLFTLLTALDVSVAPTVAGLTYGDMVNLTKINYNIGAAKYVTGNDVRVYLEQKAVNSTGIALAWNAMNNTIASRQAFASDAISAKRAIYGNFAYAGMGILGVPELVISKSATTPGVIDYGTIHFGGVGVKNKRAFKVFSADASCGV